MMMMMTATCRSWQRRCTKSPDIMKYISPDTTNPYNLRNKNPFKGSNVHTVYNGTETISFRGPKTWAIVPEKIKTSEVIIRI